MTTAGPVVVGFDGATEAAESVNAALDLAAWKAVRLGAELHIVYGQPVAPAWMPESGDATGRDAAAHALAGAAARTAAAHPGLAVVDRLVDSGTAGALVAASAGASLVVVPADTRVHYGGLQAGLVSIQVAAHARAPVVVVPAPPGARREWRRRVVVGVDASPGGADTIGYAFAEAADRGATVHAVHVWDLPGGRLSRLVTPHDGGMAQLGTAAERMLAEQLVPWRDMYPGVPVEGRAVHNGNPVRSLNDAGAEADLIVVGPRGTGGFAGLVLGSVTDGLVRYAHTPVVVVRPAHG